MTSTNGTHPPPDDARPWLKIAELADRERVTRRTIARWLDKGIVEAKRHAPRVGVRVRLREG